jgi:hypothetical protein
MLPGDIRLRSSRLSALLDATATSQSVNDDETEILSVPVRLRHAGREIRMVIDGTDSFAASKPDARLIRLLIRACRFKAALAQGEGIHFAALAQREGVGRSLFHRARPPQLSRAGYHPSDPRWAAAA